MQADAAIIEICRECVSRSYRAIRTVIALLAILGPAAAPLPARAAVVEEISLSEGATLWLVHEPSIPLISVRLAFPQGALHDPPGKEGLASLVAALLVEGAGARDAQAFARDLADLGARLTFNASRDQLFGGFETVSRNARAAADLLRQSLLEPRFDPDAFERAKEQRLAELEIASREPRRIAFERWWAETYAGQPHARPVDGTPASVGAITLDDVKRQHKQLVATAGLKVVLVGDLDRAGATGLLGEVLRGMPAARTLPAVPERTPRRVGTPVAIGDPFPLATAAFGVTVLRPLDPDYPALEVLNHIIGSGDFDSVLMDEIRVKRGLAYAASTTLVTDTTGTIMLGGMASKPDAMPAAVATLSALLDRLAKDGPSPASVEAAKSYLSGTDVLDHDGNARRSQTLIKLWLQGASAADAAKGKTRIRDVRHADVVRVARRFLPWDGFNLITVGAAAAR